jgi:hypothetical protein
MHFSCYGCGKAFDAQARATRSVDAMSRLDLSCCAGPMARARLSAGDRSP